MEFEDQFESEVNNSIILAMSGIGTVNEERFYRKAVKELKKTKMKYWDKVEDKNLKFKLLRNLSIMIGLTEGLENSKMFAQELYNLVIEDNYFKDNYKLDYCRGREEYVDTFKDELDKNFVIDVMKENMNIYNKLGVKPSFLTAKVNIFFLMEDYNSVINTLLEIHTDDEDLVGLKKQIETELAEVSPVNYKKYLKLTNMADSLIS